ncbi:unnamed protein product [Clonostachys rosea]|uniref:Uncharacterized protein n=1 Tax=Bionectria ochroleuca TaxID=29856 RepID=A0ABY6U5T4_BIOOC|nr:unnamed protein product [Clonostachys rosea]
MRRSLVPRRSQLDPSSARRPGWCLDRSYSGGWHPNIKDHDLKKEIEDRELQGRFQVGKPFTPMFDPNGHYAFHIVTPREERKDPPRQLRTDELFQMPNIVLDLDAYDAKDVRESDHEDESAMASMWAHTENQRYVQSRLEDLKQMIGESRETRSKVLSSSTNPWRITSHDVISTALRGLAPSEDSREDGAMDGESDTLRISTLTYATPDQGAQMKKYQSSRPQVATEQPNRSDSDRIDPRRSPDFLEQVRAHNGIPQHAAQSNELLLRWVLSRRDSLRYDEIKSQKQQPSTQQIASDLREQDSINGIRRVVFHSLAANADLNLDSSAQEGEQINIAQEIRDACVQVMDASTGPEAYFDTLEFVNNLSYRLPRVRENLETCIFVLRLRCLARLGKLDLAARQLQGRITTGMLNSKLNILPDIRASLESWNRVAYETRLLEHNSQRQLLFAILTGLGEKSPDGTSLRELLFDSGYPTSELQSEERREAYEEYILLLGRVGALRAIWREWKTYTSNLFQGHSLRQVSKTVAGEAQTQNVFSRALPIALSIAGPEYFAQQGKASSDPDLAECQKMDYEWIVKGIASPTEQQTNFLKQPTKIFTIDEVRRMMEPPLNDSLKAMESHRHALHTEQ